MKIAVCYSGCVRTFLQNFENHKQYLLNEHECDIYFSFWSHWGHSIRDLTRPLSEVNDKALFSLPLKSDYLSDTDKKQIIDKCNPVAYEFEDLETCFDDFNKKAEYWQKNNLRPNYSIVVSMCYKIYKCNELVKKSGKQYDVVLRIRPDIEFFRHVKFHQPKDSVYYCDMRGGWSSGGFGVNDIMGYGTQDTLNKVSNIYPNWYNLQKYMEIEPTSRMNFGSSNVSPEIIFKINFILENLQTFSDETTEYIWRMKNDNVKSVEYIEKYKEHLYNSNVH